MEPIETIWRAVTARRPLTQATTPKRLAISISGVRVGSGTCASAACLTIGASVPSTSSRTAARAGSARSGSSASASVVAAERGAPAAGTAPSMPTMPPPRTLKLAAIGTLAGLFSGLFGVGGGTVIVPLLILWRGYDERTASGTSLAAIVVIAGAAAAVQSGYDNVHVGDGLLVGIPAVAGVVAGTALQQRVPMRAISLGFAALLVASAIVLLIP